MRAREKFEALEFYVESESNNHITYRTNNHLRYSKRIFFDKRMNSCSTTVYYGKKRCSDNLCIKEVDAIRTQLLETLKIEGK